MSSNITASTLTGLLALKFLSDNGAKFCKVKPWNSQGNSPGKAPFEDDWQNKPYSFEEIQPHLKAGGNVGMICGTYSNNLIMLDADERFSEFLKTNRSLEKAPTIVRDGADKGKVIVRVSGDCPNGRKFKHKGIKSPFFEVLSNGNQGVIPPSKHPEGTFYNLINADQPIPEYSPEELDDLCGIWAGGRLLSPEEPQSHGVYPETVKIPQHANGDGLFEAVSEYWNCLSVFQHWNRASKTAREKQGTELRIFGGGGMFVKVNGGAYDVWNVPGDPGVGGGIFQAWQYCKTDDCKVPTGKGFYELLCEMATAAGIPIPDRKTPEAKPPQTQPSTQKADADEKKHVPDDGELANIWLNKTILTAYGLGDWRRYKDGVWPADETDIIGREILGVIEAARYDGVRASSAKVASVKELARLKSNVGNDVWDANQDIIVCQNGALHIPTMELLPHKPEYMATFKVGYEYDPQALADVWRYALDTTIPDAVDFLQEFVGYCLTNNTRYEMALWFYGPLGSGKSTILEGIQAMLGERATLLGLADVERSRFSLGNLRGKTLAVASEQPAIYMQATFVLNAIISGEKIKTERKFQDPIEFIPRVKLIWAMNELPRVQDAGNGLFRRVKVIKFPPMDENERDPKIKEAIKTEGAGILNWALIGLERLNHRGGFDVPECVKTATNNFQKNNDTAAAFLADCCVINPTYKVKSSLLYEKYRDWCQTNGHKPKASNTIAEDWERIGFDKKKEVSGMFWNGVGLRHNDGKIMQG